MDQVQAYFEEMAANPPPTEFIQLSRELSVSRVCWNRWQKLTRRGFVFYVDPNGKELIIDIASVSPPPTPLELAQCGLHLDTFIRLVRFTEQLADRPTKSRPLGGRAAERPS
jgi:hypothetical protein